MNKLRLNKIFLFGFGIMLLLNSCVKDNCKRTIERTIYKPQYMPYEVLRNSVASAVARTVRNPGKIFVYGNYLFVNELNEGIHIIDNSNPSAPENVRFISVPGNVDIAVIGNYLYADSYIDLVTIDISNFQNIQVTDREEDVFPYDKYQTFAQDGYYVDNIDESKGIVSSWKLEDEVLTEDCNGAGNGYWFYEDGTQISGQASFLTSSSNSGSTASQSVGKAGSMARFALYHNYLYTVDNSSLHLYNITNLSNPEDMGANITMNWGVETIFPYLNLLIIGSQTGMYIYDNSNPSSPALLSEYSHRNACDPVVVQGDYAYVTLRDGNACNGFENQLDIVDISDLNNPLLVKTVDMNHPHGLSIDGDALIICEGSGGLKVFDASDPVNVIEKEHLEGFQAYDVITFNKHVILTGSDGIYQFSLSDSDNLTLLSIIPVINW